MKMWQIQIQNCMKNIIHSDDNKQLIVESDNSIVHRQHKGKDFDINLMIKK